MTVGAPPRRRTLRGIDAPPTAPHADHRDRLMAGLADAIREKGLARTQVSDIVRHARASRSTFYRCFDDKDACFLALAASLGDATRQDVAAAVDPAAPWEDQVDQAIDAFLGLLDSDRPMTVMFAHDLPMLGERGAQVRRQSIEQWAELLVRLAGTEHMRAQGIDAVPIEKAVMLMAGLDGMVVRAVERGESLRGLAPTAKDVIKRVLAPAR